MPLARLITNSSRPTDAGHFGEWHPTGGRSFLFPTRPRPATSTAEWGFFFSDCVFSTLTPEATRTRTIPSPQQSYRADGGFQFVSALTSTGFPDEGSIPETAKSPTQQRQAAKGRTLLPLQASQDHPGYTGGRSVNVLHAQSQYKFPLCSKGDNGELGWQVSRGLVDVLLVYQCLGEAPG